MKQSGPDLIGTASRRIVVGAGTRRGVSLTAVRAALAECLSAAAVHTGDIAAVVTIDHKRDEPALLELCELLCVPLTSLGPERLALQRVPSPSDTVRRLSGTPSVAEAAVLAVGAHLLMPKRVGDGVTIALGLLAQPSTAVRPRHEMEPR